MDVPLGWCRLFCDLTRVVTPVIPFSKMNCYTRGKGPFSALVAKGSRHSPPG